MTKRHKSILDGVVGRIGADLVRDRRYHEAILGSLVEHRAFSTKTLDDGLDAQATGCSGSPAGGSAI